MNYKLLYFDIFRKKRLFKFSSIVFSIIIIGYIFLCSLSIGIEKLYINKQTEYIENLFLNISSDKNYYAIKSDITNINSVVEIYPLAEINVDEYSLIYHDDRLISILEGRKITKRNELLISNYNSKYKIGDVLEIKGESFTIVGIYDFLTYQFANSENITSDSFYCSYEFYMDNLKLDDVYSAILRIDDYEHLESVREQLSKYMIGSYSKGTEVLERLLNFQQNIRILIKVFNLFAFFLIMMVMAVIVHDNQYDWSIFKSFGYSNLFIIIILLIQTLLLFLINFIVSVAIVCLIFCILKLLNISILIFSISSIIKCFLLFVISIFINLIISFVIIKKIDIVKVLKSI